MGTPTYVTDTDIMERISGELRKGRRVALAVIVEKIGSGPRSVGAKMAVIEDGTVYGTLGGGPFERDVVEKALEAIREGRPRLLKYNFSGRQVSGSIDTGLICGGMVTVYIDVLVPFPRIYVVGVGRIGKPLSDILSLMGYKVVVLDTVEELVDRDKFPYALDLVVGDAERLGDYIVENAREGDIVLIVHGEVDVDYTVLSKALGSRASYIGLLGSRRKVIEFVKRLVSSGVGLDIIRDKLYAPIGIDIGCETPGEIALSIASQVVSWIRGRAERNYRVLDIIRTEIIDKAIS